LDENIEKEWMFWFVYQEYPEIILLDFLSYPVLQKMFAIVRMKKDQEIVNFQYDKNESEIKNKQGM